MMIIIIIRITITDIIIISEDDDYWIECFGGRKSEKRRRLRWIKWKTFWTINKKIKEKEKSYKLYNSILEIKIIYLLRGMKWKYKDEVSKVIICGNVVTLWWMRESGEASMRDAGKRIHNCIHSIFFFF